jgi:putative endonuclease
MPASSAARPKLSRQQAEQRGRKAEARAAWWLRMQGWTVLAERVRVSGGEVDLIVRRGRTLVFVEVKQRATEEAASWALDRSRLQRVAVAAEQLAPRYMEGCDTVRIDAVLMVPGRLPRHLQNVWFG